MHSLKKFLTTVFVLFSIESFGQDLIITGVIDGPLTGGTPKAVELYATADIADLSLYAVGSANNGGGTDGPEFSLSGSATSGDFIYVASESTEFTNWFGFAPDMTSGVLTINGDDAIELFYDATGTFLGAELVIDVFGEISSVPGAWSYLDGWAYRNDATGPDGTTFTIGNWMFSGANALDLETSNATASTPFPAGSYSPVSSPVWSPTFPYLNNVTTTSFDILGQTNEQGTMYYVVVPFNALAPSSAQVVAGSAPGGTLFSGSKAISSAFTTETISVAGLIEGLDYDVYVVAEDDETTPNLQSEPIKLSFPPRLVAVTEFMNNSLGSETTDEWIELYNYGLNPVDLTGWSISDEDSDNNVIASATINPSDYIILAKSKIDFESQWLGGTPDSRVIQHNMALADGADEIILSNDDGDVVWSLAYPAGATEGTATYLGYSESSTTTTYGSKSSPGINRSGNDSSGSTGYEDSGDALAYSSTNSDSGSPLNGEYAQPLPVELLSFTVEEEFGNAVLKWATISEVNNDGFLVQKSIDGDKFYSIGYISGNGNTNDLQTYNYVDNAAYQKSYYRLKQVDFDGKFEYSWIVSYEPHASIVGIFPNPIKNSVKVVSPENEFQLVIYTNSGRSIFSGEVSGDVASKILLDLQEGEYIVELSSQNFHYKSRIIKF
ncbi:lamin tail domain-containing protein [Ekhidna sp.]|uniref:lamin tail domain-containing protein n=1 Tax=Ekhidna sp. TaxID=2608089 RepID=UPI003515ED6C